MNTDILETKLCTLHSMIRGIRKYSIYDYDKKNASDCTLFFIENKSKLHNWPFRCFPATNKIVRNTSIAAAASNFAWYPGPVTDAAAKEFLDSYPVPLLFSVGMDDNVKRLQQGLVEVEIEAERLLLAKQQLVECDRSRNSNREALTALRKQA
ncbi:hypothetical protein SUGI_0272360 [Cryptomeria japonica]|nr:hypothetical protein SUGI_0272360 [Cryptomeria japonica]